MDPLLAGLYFIAIVLWFVGGIWLCLIAYRDTLNTPWRMWLFPIYLLALGFANLRKTKYPMLILGAAILFDILTYLRASY